MKNKSLLEKMKVAFIRSIPYSVPFTLALFTGACFYQYDQTIRAADLNGDGITTEQELREVFRGIGKPYNDFGDIIVNSKSIRDYCSRR